MSGQHNGSTIPSKVLLFPLPPEAEPAECDGCSDVVRVDELLEGSLCEQCSLEAAESQWEALRADQADRQNDDEKLRF